MDLFQLIFNVAAVPTAVAEDEIEQPISRQETDSNVIIYCVIA